jgi:hypothetical protein
LLICLVDDDVPFIPSNSDFRFQIDVLLNWFLGLFYLLPCDEMGPPGIVKEFRTQPTEAILITIITTMERERVRPLGPELWTPLTYDREEEAPAVAAEEAEAAEHREHNAKKTSLTFQNIKINKSAFVSPAAEKVVSTSPSHYLPPSLSMILCSV